MRVVCKRILYYRVRVTAVTQRLAGRPIISAAIGALHVKLGYDGHFAESVGNSADLILETAVITAIVFLIGNKAILAKPYVIIGYAKVSVYTCLVSFLIGADQCSLLVYIT